MAQIAGLYEFPKDALIQELLMTKEVQDVLISAEAPDDTMLEGLHKLAKKALDEGNAERAFGFAMLYEVVG